MRCPELALAFAIHLICMMCRRGLGPELVLGGFPFSASRESESALDYTEVLRRLAISDERLAEECANGVDAVELDSKTLALVRLAALVTVVRHRSMPPAPPAQPVTAPAAGPQTPAPPAEQDAEIRVRIPTPPAD